MNTAAILDILVRAQTATATANLTKLDRQMKATAATATTASNSIGTRLGRAAKYAGAAAAGGLAYGLYKGAQAGLSFEKQMDSLGAVTDSNAKSMKQLQKQALEFGKKSAFSANEVAAAQTELAKGGLKVKEILGGALPAALDLAAAGQLDLADAASTTVNSMKLFGLEGEKAGSVADMLATAANKTTADVSDFSAALAQGGSAAKAAGLDLNDTVTILEALAESGIKNSDAGTSMKTALLQLIAPTTKQAALTKQLGLNFLTANGNLKDAAAISDELHDALDGQTKAQQTANLKVLAGTDGFRTLAALYDEGSKKLGDLTRANEEEGTAQEVARKKMDNTAGSIEKLKGSLETLAVEGWLAVAPAVQDAIDSVSKFVDEFGKDVKKLGLQKAIENAIPKVAHAAAEMGKKAIESFVSAWWHSDLLGKLFLGAGALRLFGGPGVFGKLGATISRKVLGGMSSTVGGSAGGLLSKFSALGATPARPMFVAVVNGGMPGGDIPGGTGTKGGWWNTAKSWGKGAALGGARGGLEAAGVIVVLGAAAGTAAIGGAAGSAIEDSLAPDGAGGLTKAQKNVAKLREEIKKLAEAGEAIPLHMITKAGLDAQELKAAGYNVTGLRVNIKNLSDALDASKGGFSRFTKQIRGQFGSLESAAESMSKGQRSALVDAAKAARDAGSITERQFGKIIGLYGTAEQKNRQMWQDVARVTGEKTGDIKRAVGDMAVSVSKDYDGMVTVTGQGIELLTSNTNAALKGLGVAQIPFSIKGTTKHPGGHPQGAQTGAVIGVPGFRTGSLVPGVGSGDKVPLHLGGRLAAMVEPGELVSVANRNATAALMAHNKAVPRFADGGVIQQALGPYTIPPIQYDANHAGGNSHLHLDFFTVGQALAYGHKMQGMGWNIGEYTPKGGNPWGFGGISTQHQSPGHYDGTAFDANTAADETRAEVEAVVRMLGGSAKGLGAAVEQLKKVMLSGPDGPLKDMAQGAIDKTYKAANAYLQKHTPSVEGGVSYMPGGSGNVPVQIGNILTRQGFERAGAAGIIGNAYAESTWNPAAMEPGTDNGGLWGFTSGEKSLAGLRAYAAKLKKPWTDVGAQTAYMLGTVDGDLKEGLNRLGSPEAAAELFMNVWERPGDPRLDVRQKGARMAYDMKGWQHGGIVAKLAKGGFLDPFIDKVYGAKDGKKQTAADIRKATTKALGKKIDKLKTKGLFFDGSGEISGKLASLSDQAAMFGDYAGYASSTGDDGKGLFRGKTEAEWRQQQLDSLWAFRQMLAKVEVKVKERQKEAEKIAKRAQRLLKAWDRKLTDAKDQLAKEGVTPEKWKGINPAKDSPEKWNKLGENKRLDIAAKFYKAGGKLPGDRALLEDGRLVTYEDNPGHFPNVKGMSAVASMLKGTAIPRLTGSDGVIPSLATDIKTLADSFDTVQGPGYTHRLLKHGLPELGAMNALGGDIFNVQSRLAELGKPTGSDDSNVLDIAGISDIVEAARFGTFDYRIDPTFAGMFARGGRIAAGKWGVAGETGLPEIVQGPARVYSPSESARMSSGDETFVGYADVYIGGEKVAEQVRMEFAKRERQAWLAEKAGR